MCMDILPVCIWVPQVCPMPAESRKGCQTLGTRVARVGVRS